MLSTFIFITNLISILPLYSVILHIINKKNSNQKSIESEFYSATKLLQHKQLYLQNSTLITEQLRSHQCELIENHRQQMKIKQYIWSNRENREITHNELMLRFSGKYNKLIVITPGGLYGYYMLGIVRYIRSNYDLNNYVFTGSSAGSWCCLIFCLRDKKKLNMLMLDWLQGVEKVLNETSLYEFMFYMKKKIMELTTDKDYDFERMFIGVLKYENYELKTTIYCNFHNLDDALNCCIASSNIPFLTGEFNHTYQGNIAFDGVFSKYPYLNIFEPTLVINPNLWKTPNIKRFGMSLLCKNKINILNLSMDGYNDCLINNELLEDFLENEDE
jgi:hypothetical protein